MSSSTTVALTNAQAESLVTLILASLALVVVLSLAFYVLHVIAYWKMFTKAGKRAGSQLFPSITCTLRSKLRGKTGKPSGFISSPRSRLVSCLALLSTPMDRRILLPLSWLRLLASLLWFGQFVFPLSKLMRTAKERVAASWQYSFPIL